MFKLTAKVSDLLASLQTVTGIVERRHTLPILANVLIESHQGLRFIATDLEVQITAHAELQGEGSVTVASKKLFDILRALPGDAEATLDAKEGRLLIKAAKSRFNLHTLPAGDFPKITEVQDNVRKLTLKQGEFKRVLNRTQFAMAVQDIRYYLNGVLISIEGETLRVVATDGHRLSVATQKLDQPQEPIEAILPRKTVLELSKTLNDSDSPIEISIARNQAKFVYNGVEIISKIVEGKFPDYQKVIPTNQKSYVDIERVTLQQALQRAAILSSEKIRGVRLLFGPDSLSIICNNNEQEDAEESLTIDYKGEPLDMGFNIAYLLDVLSNLDSAAIRFGLGEASASALLQIPDDDTFKYVVMPMRI